MRRPRLTDEQRRLIFEEINERKALRILHERRKRLYNRQYYRKSTFFISMWAIRLIYVIMFFVIVFMDSISGGYRDEVVKYNKSESYNIYTKRNGTYLETCIKFTTNKNNYTAYFYEENLPPYISNGDTLQIERDIFNKSIFFTRKDWDLKYRIDSYFDDILWFINLLVVIFTLISFAFNDGLYKFNNMVLKFVCTNIAISSSIYLLVRLYYLVFG